MISTQMLAACTVLASQLYQIPSEVVLGIMQVEAGSRGIVQIEKSRVELESGPNSDGSYDLRLMQVKSVWLPRLEKLWHVDHSTVRRQVCDNACSHVYASKKPMRY